MMLNEYVINQRLWLVTLPARTRTLLRAPVARMRASIRYSRYDNRSHRYRYVRQYSMTVCAHLWFYAAPAAHHACLLHHTFARAPRRAMIVVVV